MNKFEKFALAMSEQLYQMRKEDVKNNTLIADDNKIIPDYFIDVILNDQKHITAIKEKIRMSVLEDVKLNPDDYDKNDNKYVYIIDEYIIQQYVLYNPVMKNVHVCDFCNTNNVQTLVWVKPNNNNEFIVQSEEINDEFCDDCNMLTTLSVVEKNWRHDIIGFQVRGDNGTKEDGKIHPDIKNEKSVFNLEQARSMINNNDGQEQWKLMAIWTTDIEKPIMMFNGDLRD